jgi:hypothetical protein
MKKLIEGESKIGRLPSRNSNGEEDGAVTVFYGNIIINDKGSKSHLPYDYYEKVLIRFLESKRGLEYEVPSEISDKVNRPSDKNEEKATMTVQDQQLEPEDETENKKSEEAQPEEIKTEVQEVDSEPEEKKPTFAEIREQRKLEKKQEKERKRQERLEREKAEQEEKQRQKELEEQRKQEELEKKRQAELEEQARKEKELQEQQEQELENLEKSTEYEEDDPLENTQSIEVIKSEKTKEVPKGYTVKMMVMLGITISSLLITVFTFLCLFGKIPNMNPALSNSEKKVVHLINDVSAGQVITKDDVESVYVTSEQYDEMSGSNVIKADGETMTDSLVLYDNISDVIGKYATDNLSSGDYLMLSDYSDIAEGESVITMNVDGTETTIPINVTTAGKSSINLYAIVTTTAEDGTKKTLALNMGTFSLEGRTLEDVLNSDGKSVIGDLLKDAESSSDAKAEEKSTDGE